MIGKLSESGRFFLQFVHAGDIFQGARGITFSGILNRLKQNFILLSLNVFHVAGLHICFNQLLKRLTGFYRFRL